MVQTIWKHRRLRLAARAAVTAAAVLALSACSLYDSVFSSASSSSSTAAGNASSSCPAPVILRPLANTALFPTPSAAPRPEQVSFYGVLSDASASCEVSGSNLMVKLAIVIVGQRGPTAGTAEGVDLDYFVAATGPDRTIISKNPFRVHIAFPDRKLRAGVTDHVDEVIPLAGRSPANINLVVGFQLSPTAVAFYQHFRGR